MRGKILILVFFLACTKNQKSNSHAAQAETPVKSPVAQETKVIENSSLKLRPIKEVSLENGLKILFIRDNSLPRVNLKLIVKVGSRYESDALAGVNNLTADLLEAGTVNKTATDLADEMAALGIDFESLATHDLTYLSIDALSLAANEALSLFYEIISSPAFEESEIQRLKDQTIARLKKLKDNPDSFANSKFNEFLYAGHPYGRLIAGTEESIKKIRRQDLIKNYLNWYRPNNSSLAVVGDLNDQFESKVLETFKSWPKRNLKNVTTPQLSDLSQKEVHFYGKEKLAQAQIYIGQLGIPRKNPDHLKLKMANQILGGGFVSRLNMRIRDEMGLTYAIQSEVDARFDRGDFTIATFTKNESVKATLEQIYKELNKFVSDGVSEKELNETKAMLAGQFPSSLETPESLASLFLMLDTFGLPKSEVTEYLSRLEKVTAVDVNEAIKKYYSAKNLKILIYGDEKIVLPQLKDENPKVFRVN